MADLAKTLIRTVTRTIFKQPKQILIIDALLLHSVLHVDDLAYLLSTQGKDIRALLNSLRAARLVSTAERSEARVNASRATKREYHYINYHETIDAIKYKIVRLGKVIADTYKEGERDKKDWVCENCRATYDEFEILDKVGPDGFYCDRCQHTLTQNEEAVRERGNHVKIRQVNDQLLAFNRLIAKIDATTVPENDFETAWERRLEVKREVAPGQAVKTTMDVTRVQNMKRQEVVSAENVKVEITSQSERDREDAVAKEKRRQELARQNALPEWHTASAIGPRIKIESPATLVKKEETELEEKPIVAETATAEDDFDEYVKEMERERLEAERKQVEREDEEEEEDDFEDVVGTPNPDRNGTDSKQQNGHLSAHTRTTSNLNVGLNGLKREAEDSFSEADGNTPQSSSNDNSNSVASAARSAKKLKMEVEHEDENAGTRVNSDVDDEDEDGEDDDFEDVNVQ